VSNVNLILNIPEPKVYRRKGKDCYLDEVSKKLRIKTPEETIRQKLIKYLNDQMHIPYKAMGIEVPLSYFRKGAKGRADVIVYGAEDNGRVPVMLIECKAPSVTITDDVYQQADRYADVVGVAVVGVTNGVDFFLDCWDDSDKQYKQLTAIPNYDELCTPQEIETIDFSPIKFKRHEYSSLKSDSEYKEAVKYGAIGEDTPKKYAPFIINLYDCLMDDSLKCEGIKVAGYNSVTDMGLRHTDFGNAAGGGFAGIYRCFLMEDAINNTQIVSISIFGIAKLYNDKVFGNRRGSTCLLVGIDDYDSHHSSLELCIEDHVLFDDSHVNIWHDGKMAVSNIGSAKRSDVVKYISERAKDLAVGGKIYLGRLDNSWSMYINTDDVTSFLGKIIEYALLRDEYRAVLKADSQKK